MCKFETSKTSGKHHWLSQLEGKWEGRTKTWFEENELADESPIEGTMKLVLGGRMILHEYKSSLQGKPLEGMAFYGYNLTTEKFQAAWIDSFHNGTAIMFSESKKTDESCSMVGSYAYITPETEQYWGWRTDIEIVDNDTVIITCYNITPDGKHEAKATETMYKRV